MLDGDRHTMMSKSESRKFEPRGAQVLTSAQALAQAEADLDLCA